MKLSILVAIPALLAPVVAQKQTKCAAQFIVDQCLQIQDAAIGRCNAEPACVCQGHKDRLTCYNGCLDDAANKGAAETQKSQVTIFCNAAEASKPTTTTVSDPKATSTTTGSAEHSGSSSDNHKSGSGSDSNKSGSGSTTKSGSSSASASQHASFGIIALSVGVIAAFL